MPWRITLLALQALIAVSSAAGGIALILGERAGEFGIVPPAELLEGSPFTSYLVPGLALLLVIGGTHALAFVMLGRGHRWALAAAAVAGSGLLIWIFVQMVIIPFSVLQAVYFGAGLAELVLVLLMLDVLHAAPPRAGTKPARREPAQHARGAL